MFHFSQRKRTDNTELTQNKAQKSALLDKMGFDLHPHTRKSNSKKVEKDTKRGRSTSCSCHFFFPSGQNYCFPWLFALLDNLPVVSWRQHLGTKPSGHAGMSSKWNYLRWESPGWCGRQRTPIPAKRSNLLEKIDQSMNPTKRSKRSRKAWISPWLGFTTRKEFQFPFKSRAELFT